METREGRTGHPPGRELLLAACLLSVVPLQAGAAQRVSVIEGPVHVLRHLTHLLKPSVAPSNRLCTATAGDSGTVIDTAASDASPVVWVQVRFDAGDCRNVEGWVAAEVLRQE